MSVRRQSSALWRRGHDPLFSVVVPTYQRADLVQRAIRSVLAQTMPDFEILVQDDGSSDDTEVRLRELDDPRIRYARMEHQGRGTARNAGASRARGRYLAFLDSDDEVDPAWLSRLAGALTARIGLVCCGMRIQVEDHAGKTRDVAVDLPRTMRPLLDVDGVLLRAGTFAVRRRLFLDVGGYVTTIRFSENTELSLRLLPRCLAEGLDIGTVPEALVLVHYNRSRPDEDHYRGRLQASEYLLAHHGPILRRDPAYYSRYRRIAAANAARLGQFDRARRHLLEALRWAPSPGGLAAVGLTLVPGLRRLWWREGGG